MKLSCIIDGNFLELNVNSQKSLLNILIDDCDIEYLKNKDRNGLDYNSIVIVDNVLTLSSLVPAFAIKNKKIETFITFKKKYPIYKKVLKKYHFYNTSPCKNCYESKTLIINYLINKYNDKKILEGKDEEFILNELSLVKCNCTNPLDLLKIVKSINQELRKKNV